MKILILGSTGVLGKNLNLVLSRKKNIEIFYISRKKNLKKHIYLNDFTNFYRLEKLITKIDPSHIINCLGITHFNNLYKFKKKTKLINTELPKFLSKYSLSKKIYLIHISTDCVFSGKKGFYSENSKKDSIDLYGLTKNKGEIKNHYTSTIRTSFIGPETNSCTSLLNWFLKQKKQINGYNKAYFSGLTSLELSFIIYKYFLKEKFFYNYIVNVSGNKISKFALLNKIALTFKKKILIKKFSDFKIDRTLNNSFFIKKTKYKVKSWNKMLLELKIFMIKNNYKF